VEEIDRYCYGRKRNVSRTTEDQLHCQKKTFNYTEANEVKRQEFLDQIKDIDPASLVFSDETGMDDNEVSLTGWSPRGERCHDRKKAERTTRYNITAALNLNLLFAPFLFEGYSNSLVYEAYVEHVLAPALKPGMVVIIDNASFHKSKRTVALIEAAGCRIIFLPPYSPDFNPIEHHWTAVKNAIRKAAHELNSFYDAAVFALGEMCAA
jgi:transposase